MRLDRAISSRNSIGAVYTIDDSRATTATPLDPYGADLLNLREQVFSLQDTHVFSPAWLNTARFGFSRAGYFFTGEPTPGTPAASGARASWRGFRSAPSWSAAARRPIRRLSSDWRAATTAAT